MCPRFLLLPITIFFAIGISYAQGVYDTTYYRGVNDSTFDPNDKIVQKEFAHYYRTPGTRTDDAHHVISYFLIDGTPSSVATFRGIDETANPFEQFLRASREGLQQTYYQSGKIMEEYFLSNGLMVGTYKAFYHNGKLERIVDLIDSGLYQDVVYFDSVGYKLSQGRLLRVSKKPETYVRNGLWKFYHDQSDRISHATTYVNDIETGLYMDYDSVTQRVMLQGMNKAGLGEGEWLIFYYDTTAVMYRMNYSKDKRHGPYYGYHLSGKISESGQYKDGLREGVFRRYYENGNLESETIYRGGIGNAVFFDSTGKIVTGEGSFIDDMEHGTFTLYHSGTKKPMVKYEVVDGLLEGKFREYHSDGHLIAERTYVKNSMNGPFHFNHPFSDKVWISGTYQNDTLHGDGEVYYRSGQLKRKIVFDRGKRVVETCYSLSNETEDCQEFISEAVYKEDIQTYIGNNLVYPEQAKKQKIEGKTIVRFEVDAEGLVTNVRLIKGFNTLCDQEAVRLIQNMGRWVPARVDDKNVSFYKTVPVVFWLP